MEVSTAIWAGALLSALAAVIIALCLGLAARARFTPKPISQGVRILAGVLTGVGCFLFGVSPLLYVVDFTDPRTGIKPIFVWHAGLSFMVLGFVLGYAVISLVSRWRDHSSFGERS